MARKQYTIETTAKKAKPANFGSKRAKHKAELILQRNKHNCIPKVENAPIVYADGMGEWERFTGYDEQKKKRIEYLKTHYGGGKHYKRKKPWYFLTSGKQSNYEERTKSWGHMTAVFRVKSEAGIAFDKTVRRKRTHEDYIKDVLKDHLRKWEMKHPEPQQTIDGTINAFYEEEISKWKADREDAWNAKQISMKEKPRLAQAYVEHLHPEMLKAA